MNRPLNNTTPDASDNTAASSVPSTTSGLGKKLTVDVVQFTQGQYILREGDDGDTAYILVSGEVEVVKSNPQGKSVVIAVLGPNEIFGEMCLFETESTRSASVRVISDYAEVMAISKHSFKQQVEELPEGIKNIVLILIERLRRADSRIVLLC